MGEVVLVWVRVGWVRVVGVGEGGGCRVDRLDDDGEYQAIVRNKLLGGCSEGGGSGWVAVGEGGGCG